jgi:Protein of unknown function (DUF2845)
MKKRIVLTLLLPVLTFSAAVQGESTRCDGVIIDEGMTEEEVRQHCGPPDRINTETHYYWVYMRDAGDTELRIYFYANGEVEQIDSRQ